MTIGDIIRNLPEILQNQIAVDTYRYKFESDTNVYTFTKAPIMSVLEVVDGDTTYTQGVDFTLIKNANSPVQINGGDVEVYDAIDWSIGGDSPADGDTFIVEQRYETILSRYLKSHDEETNTLDQDIIDVVESKQIETAVGDELDRVGAIFGQLGKRSGRSDTDYRAFLKSVVNSFSGRGSRSGLKFAIAAAVGTTPDNIEIEEDFENLEYSVTIRNVDTEFISSAIDELADLAGPSGVKLDETLITIGDSTIVIEGTGTALEAETAGLGSGILTLDGNSTLG